MPDPDNFRVPPFAEHCASCTCRDHLDDDDLADPALARVHPSPAPRRDVRRAASATLVTPARPVRPVRPAGATRRALANLLLDLCCLVFLVSGAIGLGAMLKQALDATDWPALAKLLVGAGSSVLGAAILVTFTISALRRRGSHGG